jgi:hypothetical protein
MTDGIQLTITAAGLAVIAREAFWLFRSMKHGGVAPEIKDVLTQMNETNRELARILEKVSDNVVETKALSQRILDRVSEIGR